MIVNRDLLEKIKPFILRKEYLAITGPRQSGKTTFLEIIRRYLIDKLEVDEENIRIITFEDRRLLIEFEENPISFIKSWRTNQQDQFYLLIDEFQYAKDGGQKLKLVYDTLEKLKIIITGSSSLEIASKVKSYMTGRLLTFNMYPFSFKEFLKYKNKRLEKIYIENNEKLINYIKNYNGISIKEGKDTFRKEFLNLFEEYCIWGGYPSVVLSNTEIEKEKIISNIFNSYILSEIKGLIELDTERQLFLLSQMLSAQMGGIVVYNNLGNQCGLNYKKLIKHLNILRATFIIRELKPYFKNKQKELSKNPKIYFIDNGFRNYLIKNYNRLNIRNDAGSLIEGVVFNRISEGLTDSGNPYFWRTKVGAEVDFVLLLRDSAIPIEVKFAEFKKPVISKSYISFINNFKPDYGLVLTKDYWGKLQYNGTEVVFAPVYYL
ncbi:MAG: ATP-binding protein [Actinomycetota bacterium]